jgi:hypothetical protein
MTLQPVRTGFMRNWKFDGSHPVHRLRNKADGARLVTASERERADLVASGRFTYDGVIGYAYGSQQPGTAKLLRYSKAGEWRLALEPPHGQDLTRAGYKFDGSVGYVDVRWIRAGALYFGMWNSGTRNVIDAAKRVYGRDGDWWGGVRDYSGADPSVPLNRWAWPREDFSYLQPALGFYEDTQTATVEKHITQASSAGLRYFAFYWYWSGPEGRETIAGGLRSFLRARNRNAMDFALTVCSHRYSSGSLSIPKSQYASAASTLVEHMRQPNYLRANDGRRILWLCDTRGMGSGSAPDVKAFVDAVRSRARAVLGEDILVLAHRDLGLNLAAVGADGAYCGATYPPDGSYRRYVSEQRKYFAGGPPVFVRCATSDFDERPRYPMFYSKPEEARNMADRTPALFGQAVRNVRDDIAASTRPSLVDNFVLFYSWNEWHEGGIPLEPNARDGCANLDIARSGLGLTSGPGCIARPPDDAPAPAPAPPPPATSTALQVRVKVPRKQKLRGRAVVARVRCSLTCRIKATGKVRMSRKRLQSRSRKLKPGRWTTVRLKASKRTHARVRRALRGHRKVRIKVSVRAEPLPAGAKVKATRTARLRRA